jgi:hypothetical protein
VKVLIRPLLDGAIRILKIGETLGFSQIRQVDQNAKTFPLSRLKHAGEQAHEIKLAKFPLKGG